jgi:predicted HTH domain antitoxin
MPILQVDVPSDVLTLPDQTAETLATPAREALIVRLYDQDMVSSGWAAQALGMSRREFLDLLGQYGVSEFDETLDVAEEQRRAIAARTIDYLVGVGLLDLLPRQ